MLSEAERREFSERGFVFTDVVFTAEELAPVRQACLGMHRDLLERPELNDQQRTRPFLPDVAARDPSTLAFTRHPAFQALARELIGPDVDQTWNQACLKLPGGGPETAFPIHQDGKFAQVNHATTGFACFVALQPLSVENGTLCFVPGAHRRMLDHSWDETLLWWRCHPGARAVPAVLAPGQMAIYHPMTPHGGPPNETAAAREAFLVTYNLPDVRLVETGEPAGDGRPLLRGGRLVAS